MTGESLCFWRFEACSECSGKMSGEQPNFPMPFFWSRHVQTMPNGWSKLALSQGSGMEKVELVALQLKKKTEKTTPKSDLPKESGFKVLTKHQKLRSMAWFLAMERSRWWPPGLGASSKILWLRWKCYRKPPQLVVPKETVHTTLTHWFWTCTSRECIFEVRPRQLHRPSHVKVL